MSRAICAKPPMPIAPLFLHWTQQHPEGGEIYRCAEKFLSDKCLANILDVPFTSTPAEWEKEVRAKLGRGHPIDYIDRPYIPPDWENKVYPLIGDPPVWSTEDVAAYKNLRDELTQMLKPCDPWSSCGRRRRSTQFGSAPARHGRRMLSLSGNIGSGVHMRHSLKASLASKSNPQPQTNFAAAL